jgi:hypothetical protein
MPGGHPVALWLLAISSVALPTAKAIAVPSKDANHLDVRQVGATPGTCIYYSNQCVTQYAVYICDSGNCSKDDNPCNVISGVSYLEGAHSLAVQTCHSDDAYKDHSMDAELLCVINAARLCSWYG